MKKFLKIVSLSLLFLYIMAEIALRVKFKEQLKTRHYPLIYRPDSLFGFTYIPNTVSKLSEPSINKTFTVNSLGFYGPVFKKEKSAKVRIALVGSSDDGGIWLNGEKNYSMILQDIINENHIDAEVVNFSLDGKQRDLYNVNIVKHIVMPYRPDYVLFTTYIPFITGSFRRDNYKGYVISYSGTNSRSKEWCMAKVDYVTSHTLLTILYEYSYIVRAICRYYMYRTTNKQYATNLKLFVEKKIQAPDIRFLPYSITKTVKVLQNLQDTLQKSSSKLVIFDYHVNKGQKRLLDNYQLNSLSLNIPDGKDMHYKFDGHYNEKAHEVIAHQLFDSLLARKYIYK